MRSASRWSALAFGVLLLWFPRRHREAYGQEMLEVFLESEREASTWAARAAVYGRMVLDAVGQGLAVRWEHFRRRRANVAKHAISREAAMSGWALDLRFAVRQLIRRPVTTVVAFVTLAVGIGGNVLLFSVVDAVLLEPPAYEDPARVVMLMRQFPSEGGVATLTAYSEPGYLALAESNRAFDALTAISTGTAAAGGEDRPFQAPFMAATADLWDVVGLGAAVGRTFDEHDDDPGAEPVVVISDRLWSTRFQRRPSAVGRSLEVAGRLRTVIGVMPPDFVFHTEGVDLWLPLVVDPAAWAASAAYNNNRRVIGRLADEATVDPERALAAATEAAKAARADAFREGEATRVVPVREVQVGSLRPTLLMLTGAVVFVLLIACANLANLMLVRAEGRLAEFAVRTSLGAGRPRLVRQLLTESLLLSGSGAMAGLVVTVLGLDVVKRLAPGAIPGLAAASVSPTVLAVTALLALGTGVVFGLAPAVVTLRTDLRETLVQGGRGGTGGRSRSRSALVVSQVAITAVLLVGAGLMVGSLLRLQDEDIGFQTEGRVVSPLLLPPRGQRTDAEFHDLLGRMTQRLAALPDVERAAFAMMLPMQSSSNWSFEAEFRTAEEVRLADYNLVTPGYFETMGIPMLEGRDFDAAEASGERPAVIVSAALAEAVFPGERAIGQRINVDLPPNRVWREVIGVVGDVRVSAPSVETTSHLYFPPINLPFATPSFGGTLILQSDRSAGALGVPVRRAVAEADPAVPMAELMPLASVVSRAEGERRFVTSLLLAFAAAGLLLSTVGLYGVLSHVVASRTREMGLRMAVGATPASLLRMVVRRGVGLAGAGALVGVAGALGLTRLLDSLLYGVEPLDARTFAVVIALLGGVALVTTVFPAWRATRIDPVRALRSD